MGISVVYPYLGPNVFHGGLIEFIAAIKAYIPAFIVKS
jgi:hypothetical protein